MTFIFIYCIICASMKGKKISINAIWAALAPAIAILLIASLTAATVILNNRGRPATRGIIGRGEGGEASGIISDAPFQYDISTRNEFIKDFEKALAAVFSKDFLDALSGMNANIAHAWGDSVIEAFRRARVPGEKLAAFGGYLKKVSADYENFIKEQHEINPDNPESLPLIIFVAAVLMTDQKNDTDNFYRLLGGLDWGVLFEQLMKDTGLTPEEAGRVMYQLAFSVSRGDDKKLIEELGERSFVILFARTAVVMREIDTLGKNTDLATARAAVEMLYELGSEYRKIINTFGVRKLNDLFGSVYLGEILDNIPEEKKDTVGNILGAVEASSELFGFGVAFLSETLLALDNKVAYPYHDYIKAEKDVSLAETALYLVSAARKGLEYASRESGIGENELKEKIASINANLKAVADAELVFEEVYAEELTRIDAVFKAFLRLAAAETEARELEYENYLKHTANVDAILGYIEEITAYAPDIGRGMQMSTSLILLSYLAYIGVSAA